LKRACLVLAESESARRLLSCWRWRCSYGNVAGICDQFAATCDVQCSTCTHTHTHTHTHARQSACRNGTNAIIIIIII